MRTQRALYPAGIDDDAVVLVDCVLAFGCVALDA